MIARAFARPIMRFFVLTKGGDWLQRRTDMFGRRKITSDAAEITDDNVLYELNRAMDDHAFNRGQIDYLWRYYRGE